MHYKTIFVKNILTVFFALLCAGSYAQAPTITSFTPTRITQRTVVTINGTNFTGVTAANVKFGGVSATAITVVSPTQIKATAALSTTATGLSVTVQNTGTNAGTATLGGLSYVAPAGTVAATAKITRVITNFGGYWSSTTTSAVVANQPDTSHSMLAFEYGGTVYSTGSATSATILNSNGVTYTTGNYRALPINNLNGTVPSSGPNLIVLGSKIDGNPTTQVATAPGVAGLSVRDVLIDGIRGLDLGTGVTNLPSSAILQFNASNIVSAGINDNIPDILISQIAEVSDDLSIYAFTDAAGNIIGNPIQVALSAIPAIGRYKSDFFTLPTGVSLNTAVINGSTTIGANTRDIRLVGYKLSEFGITDSNRLLPVYFQVMPSGTSDPAFMAYNRDSFDIPAPIITAQPTSQVACTGAGNNVTFTVTATGSELVYQWEKNGVEITGATSASYTITNVQAADVAAYRVLITNSSGAALSNYAYLNTVITLQPISYTTCLNTSVTLETIAAGAAITYQWYRNTANSTTGGTLISGAVNNTYVPPVNTAGTIYYYAVIKNNNVACAERITNVVFVTVSSPTVAGTPSPNQTICPGTSAIISLTGYSGNIRWQQSANGIDGWANAPGGSGNTTASYTTAALAETTYFRAQLTSNGCASAISGTVTITVSDTNVWTGAISKAWNTPGNWSCGIVPTLILNAKIPVVASANYPIIDNLDGVANCKSLTVDSGANILVSGNGLGTLRIAGTILNNGTINSADGTIVMKGTTAQAIPANIFATNTLRNLSIDNTAGATLSGSLDLTGILTLTAGNFTTGNALTLKSNAAYTAMIAPVTGSISGTMTIERYIPARRGFRFISSPVDGGTINANWQEGGAAIALLGTDITGTAGAAGGFDVSQSNNPSLFTYNNTNPAWVPVANTLTTNLIAGVPYRMLVRGDRTIDQTLNASPPTNTTLRSMGTIKTGDVTVSGLNETANEFSFVGNPYQAPVNMALVLATASNVNPNFYYVWDPTLGGAATVGVAGGRGAYVTVSLPQGVNATGSLADKYIQPNQAIFVQTLVNGPASLTFKEIYKDLLTRTTPLLYRTGEDIGAKISLKLYDANSLALGNTPSDGLMVEFDAENTNDINDLDAKKFGNQDENIALVNNGTNLSIERRNLPQPGEVLPLFTSQYRKANYTYTINAQGIETANASLLDKFTGTITAIDNDVETLYNFSVDAANAASTASDRFDIIFGQPVMGTGDFDIAGITLYPNPATATGFMVRMPSASPEATVEIYNAVGQSISCNAILQPDNAMYIRPQTGMASGIYIVKINNSGKTYSRKLIVK